MSTTPTTPAPKKITKKVLVPMVTDLATTFGWNTDPKNGRFVSLGVTSNDDDSVGYRLVVSDPETGGEMPLLSKDGMPGADFALFVNAMIGAHKLIHGTAKVNAPMAPVAEATEAPVAEAK